MSTRAAMAAVAIMYAPHTAADTRHTHNGRYMVGAKSRKDSLTTMSVPVRVDTPHLSNGFPAGKMAWVAVRVLRDRHAAPAASCDASAMTPEMDTAPRITMVTKPNSAGIQVFRLTLAGKRL